MQCQLHLNRGFPTWSSLQLQLVDLAAQNQRDVCWCGLAIPDLHSTVIEFWLQLEQLMFEATSFWPRASETYGTRSH